MKKFFNWFFRKFWWKRKLKKLKLQGEGLLNKYSDEEKKYRSCLNLININEAKFKSFDGSILSWFFESLNHRRSEAKIHKQLSKQYLKEFVELNKKITDLETKLNSLH